MAKVENENVRDFFRRFRLDLRVFDASAECASKMFCVFCTETVYDVTPFVVLFYSDVSPSCKRTKFFHRSTCCSSNVTPLHEAKPSLQVTNEYLQTRTSTYIIQFLMYSIRHKLCINVHCIRMVLHPGDVIGNDMLSSMIIIVSIT